MSIPFLHLADTHIGARHPSRCAGDPYIANMRRALAPARAGEVGLVLHGGDLFNRSRPPARVLAAAAAELTDAADGGARVIVTPGNHERSLIPARLLLGHPRIIVVEEPCRIRVDLRGLEVSVFAFPFVRRDPRGKFESLLRACGWPLCRADANILLCHQTFDGATVGPGEFVFRRGSDVIPRAWIPTGFDYAALGHIHRHQFLRHPRRPDLAIAYPGATERTSRAERREWKGYLRGEIAEPGAVSARFVPLPAAQMPPAQLPSATSRRTSWRAGSRPWRAPAPP